MLRPAIFTTASLSRSERLLFLAIAAATLVMRSLAFFRYRFDSDEPQHLHVAWGWTAGLLQYRDLFDNHAPLFHMAMAPLLRLAGERPDILLVMRAPMLLFFLVVVTATYVLGARLYSRRVGLWSALLLCIIPTFFLKSLEFRTDNLWNAFWMLSLITLTTPLARRADPTAEGAGDWMPPTSHAAIAGLLLGFAMAVSMKTSLLMISLLLATIVTGAMGVRLGDRRSLLRVCLALCAGSLVMPAIVAAYFWWRGAWPNLVYCVATFNELVPAMRSPLSLWVPRLLYVPAMILVLRVAWRNRSNRQDSVTRWRFFFGVATAAFFITLGGFWILISPRDFLPFLPLVSIFLVAWILRQAWAEHAALIVIVLICFVALWRETDGFANHTAEQVTLMNQVLRLTRPGEPLMDFKGETIYRRRPYYFIFEFITRNAITRGLIADTVPEAVLRSGCHVAEADGPFWPPRAAAFLNANFIDVGRLRASGQLIGAEGGFTIAVPGEYVVLTKQGEAVGRLDGTPYAGARRLEQGAHRFVSSGSDRLAFLWAPAWQRGFSPFHLQDRDF